MHRFRKVFIRHLQAVLGRYRRTIAYPRADNLHGVLFGQFSLTGAAEILKQFRPDCKARLLDHRLDVLAVQLIRIRVLRGGQYPIHGEMTGGCGGDGDGLSATAPNACIDAISSGITARRQADGCLPASRKALDDVRRRDRITEKARDGLRQKSIWKIPA